MIDAASVINFLLIGSAFGLVLCVWMVAVLLWILHRRSRASRIGARLGITDAIPTGRDRTGSGAGSSAGSGAAGSGRGTSTPSRFDALLTGTRRLGVATLLAVVAFTGAYMVLQSTLLAAGVGVAVFVIVQIYAGHRLKQRTMLFEQQLVDALELASRSLRAGHPLSSAFQLISTEMEQPVRDVFGVVCQQHAMGSDLEEALTLAAARTGSPDMRLLSTSIAIQGRTGGNVAQLMDRIARVIRERIRLGRRLRVLTAQTTLSKRILIALPIVVFFIFGLINRKYMDPFYATMAGRIMLAVAIALLALGALVMNRMTRLKF